MIRRRSPLHLLRLSWYRWSLIALGLAFGISLLILLRLFYVQNTEVVPATGGTYIEGSVGELAPLNPWFVMGNDVNRDMSSLIFSGLLRYNPETQQIEEDLATMEVSDDGTIYTLRLKDNLYWHDSTPEDPHPVTVEDVLFTFRTIQDPQFPNTLLKQNFRGVQIEELDATAVRFRLEEPYYFFPSNLTLGLLPKRAFEGIPVNLLDQTLGFGFQPIGAGPYAFKGLVQTELSTEVTLERFDRSVGEQYHLNQVVFRIFPDYSTLLSDLRNLHGVRLVPRNNDGEPLVPRRFESINYSLPQYVSLFLNQDNPFLQDTNLRLALQLGTNKQEIADTLHESIIVDTPLLEIDVSDWRYQYDLQAAQGALFNSSWHLPEKIRLQHLLERKEANDLGVLNVEPVVYLETGAVLTVTGSVVDVGSLSGSSLNGNSLEPHPTQSGAWIAVLSSAGTGTLKVGENVVRLWNDAGNAVDTFYLTRAVNRDRYKALLNEQTLLEQFIRSRDGDVPKHQQIGVLDLYLDKGVLRKRLSTDPSDIRVNESGQKLSLRLLTSPNPPEYAHIAKMIRDQWEQLGIHVGIDIPESRTEFQEKLLMRDYDILLFGQSLLDNLDSYPYWHSSGMQKKTENRNELRLDAYNLSQYSSLDADRLLEYIRRTQKEEERETALAELRNVLKQDVPAVILYSPLYTYAYHNDLQGVELGNLSLHSDRFLTLHNWYVREERQFLPDRNWLSFFPWLVSLL